MFIDVDTKKNIDCVLFVADCVWHKVLFNWNGIECRLW